MFCSCWNVRCICLTWICGCCKFKSGSCKYTKWPFCCHFECEYHQCLLVHDIDVIFAHAIKINRILFRQVQIKVCLHRFWPNYEADLFSYICKYVYGTAWLIPLSDSIGQVKILFKQEDFGIFFFPNCVWFVWKISQFYIRASKQV